MPTQQIPCARVTSYPAEVVKATLAQGANGTMLPSHEEECSIHLSSDALRYLSSPARHSQGQVYHITACRGMLRYLHLDTRRIPCKRCYFWQILHHIFFFQITLQAQRMKLRIKYNPDNLSLQKKVGDGFSRTLSFESPTAMSN
jgi:hypothetical protein